MAHPSTVSPRCAEPAQRSAAPAAQIDHWRLRRPRLRECGLMAAFEYAPAPESRDIARLKSSYQIFVDGQFRDGAGPATKTINPADEQPLAEVAEAGPSDVDDAVIAARRAYDPTWSKTPGRERANYLIRIART